MAGVAVRLGFAGEAMREVLLPPFEHLAVEDEEADPLLSISIFDNASTGVEAPPPAWEPLVAEPGTNPVARLRSEQACGNIVLPQTVTLRRVHGANHSIQNRGERVEFARMIKQSLDRRRGEAL